MPNRILRDWTDSERVNGLSVHSERFFTRLIMKVDDYGRFSANPKLLKSNLFPLLGDSIRETDIIRWMAECQKSELIAVYEVSSKPYLEIKNFDQRLRIKKPKYPSLKNDGHMTVMCQTDDGHMTVMCQTDDGHMTARNETKRNEVETESETQKNSSLTPKKFDLAYFESIGYDWGLSPAVHAELDIFLAYRVSAHKDSIRTPETVEAIIRRLRESAKTESEALFMIRNTIEKQAKNLIFELEKPKAFQQQQAETKKYQRL